VAIGNNSSHNDKGKVKWQILIHYCYEELARKIEVKKEIAAALNFSSHTPTLLVCVTIVHVVMLGKVQEQDSQLLSYGAHQDLAA
jgi:hypothetical protein